jgi:hypothetical protein
MMVDLVATVVVVAVVVGMGSKWQVVFVEKRVMPHLFQLHIKVV